MSRLSPIFDSSERATAQQAIAAIGRDLARALSSPPSPAPEARDLGRQFSLAGGDAGVALFFHFLAESGWELPFDSCELSQAFLNRAVEGLANTPMSPGLFAGFSGIAWVVQRLAEPSVSVDGADELGEIDAALLEYVEHAPRTELDLVSGVVGVGVYLLDRLPRPSAAAALAGIVDLLERSAEIRDDLVAWKTGADELSDADRSAYPQGRYDVGIAHGLPGIATFLARAAAAGIEAERAQRLCSGAWRWLRAQVAVRAQSPRFPYWFAPVGDSRATRVAWCYGDLGIATALLVSGSAAGAPELCDEGIELALRVAERPFESAGMADGGLCHGTCGAAHLFSRLYRASGDEALLRAARFWYRQTFALRVEGQGIGGFRSLIRDHDLRDRWLDSPELLNGAAGIGLSLLAAATGDEPSWDRVLLVSPHARNVTS